MHDVVIVGGSLAGSAAAIHLARKGRRVLIIEQRMFPRRKVCGEGILPMGARELDRLDLLDAVNAEGSPLRKIRFEAGGQVVEAPFSADVAGIGVRRTILDTLLLSHAASAGVEIIAATATRLTVRDGRIAGMGTADGQVYPGRAFIGADGLQSRIRRLAGIESHRAGRRYGAAAHGRIPGLDPDAVQVHFLGGHEVYITPTGNGALNVVLLLSRDRLRAFPPPPLEAIRDLLQTLPALRGLVFEEPLLVAGPFPRSARRTWRGNLVLAGDAAGFFDGITGQGMGSALVEARLCADAIDAYLSSGSLAPLRAYGSAHRRLVRNAGLLGRLTLALGARPATAKLAIRNLSRHPETFAKLVAINDGEAPLASLRPHDLLTMLTGM